MVAQIGEQDTQALTIYDDRHPITMDAVRLVAMKLWPNASPEARAKAEIICVQYNINPILPNMVHIIHFDSKTGPGKDEVILGIDGARAVAYKRTPFDYEDGPRAMTIAEVEAIGEDPKTHIWFTVTLRTPSGGRFPGIGNWPKGAQPYGKDKGNSIANMVSNRAERNALRRLNPQMPAPIGTVVDGVYADVTEIIDQPMLPRPAQKASQPAQRPATARADPAPAATVESAAVESDDDLSMSEFWAGARQLGYQTGTPKANDAICDILEVGDITAIKAKVGYRVALEKLRLAADALGPAEHGKPF